MNKGQRVSIFESFCLCVCLSSLSLSHSHTIYIYATQANYRQSEGHPNDGTDTQSEGQKVLQTGKHRNVHIKEQWRDYFTILFQTHPHIHQYISQNIREGNDPAARPNSDRGSMERLTARVGYDFALHLLPSDGKGLRQRSKDQQQTNTKAQTSTVYKLSC